MCLHLDSAWLMHFFLLFSWELQSPNKSAGVLNDDEGLDLDIHVMLSDSDQML